MRIIFNDIIQFSNANENLKTPMLSDVFNNQITFTISLDKIREIDSIGIGNTNGTYFIINGINIDFTENGLYYLNTKLNTSELIINTNATYIGRLAAGIGVKIPTSIAKEPAFCSTAEPRVTLSGQIISGIGGYNYKTISLDSRYKINEYIMNEIKYGYKYIGLGYPFFIDLSDESYKLPFVKLYATEANQRRMSFESGIRKYLFSRRWQFEERF
ncbi:MAG: hypothetical protein FWD14_01945 [Treponema sp.]|nr:hypothetical protein [Treponema sp.]